MDVKIGLISDIHCNLQGLERALSLLGDCEEVFCAGDLLCLYRFSGDVLCTVRQRRIHAIVGNHDKAILYERAHPLRSSPAVDAANLRYLAELPESLSVTIDGRRVAMFHGSPWDETGTTTSYYVYPGASQDMRRVAEYDADIIVLGHTHQCFCEQGKDGPMVVNPGSCGEPRGPKGLLTCAMVDTASNVVEFRPFSL